MRDWTQLSNPRSRCRSGFSSCCTRAAVASCRGCGRTGVALVTLTLRFDRDGGGSLEIEEFLEDGYNQHPLETGKGGYLLAVIKSFFTGPVWASSQMNSFSKTLTVTNR